MQLFYAKTNEIKEGVLSPEESLHCVKVLRKKEGEKIQLIDGLGNLYEAEIIIADAKKCSFKILQAEAQKTFVTQLHVAIAPTKNMERIEFFIEKACELGVKSITPMFTFNSERKHLNLERLHKILVSACKQSYTLTFPVLNEPLKFSDVLKIQTDQKLIGHCYSHETPHLKTFDTQKATLLLIGPEGDFSTQEVKAALDAGFLAISLGSKRLRTETAGILACSIFNLGTDV